MDKKTKYAEKHIQIGLNIAYYRKLRRMTQLQLAEAINISRTHMSNIEAPNVPTSVSLDTLFEIADVLDIDITSLFDIKKKVLYPYIQMNDIRGLTPIEFIEKPLTIWELKNAGDKEEENTDLLYDDITVAGSFLRFR
ncbi:MAG: helix-turn-helix domain-containing protein [Acetatifactor sp.]|nr:helix-turn-helix domain-containing protein [Acetatifactor sp.]